MPLFVKAGSVIPVCPEHINYADAVADKTLEIRIYKGADGSFTLYEDTGDGYGYEQGEFTRIPLSWNDKQHTLTIGIRQGTFPGMQKSRTFIAVCGDKRVEVTYEGTEISLIL